MRAPSSVKACETFAPQPGDALRAGAESGRPAGSARREARSGRGCDSDLGLLSDHLDRIGDGDSGNCGAPALGRPAIARSIKSGPTKGRAASWTRTRSGREIRQSLKPAAHRILPRLAAMDGMAELPMRRLVQAGKRCFVQVRGRRDGSPRSIRPMRGCATNAARVLRENGWPWSVGIASGVLRPARDPRPAATMRAATDIRAARSNDSLS